MFKKIVCSLLSDKKLSKSSRKTLLKKGEIVTVNTKNCGNYFSDIIKIRNIEKIEGTTCNTGTEKYAILQAII